MTFHLLGIAEFFKRQPSVADPIHHFRNSLKGCIVYAEDRASQYDLVKHTSAKAKDFFFTITHKQHPFEASQKLIHCKDLGQELQSLAIDLYAIGRDLEKSASSPLYSNSRVRNNSTLFLEDIDLCSNDESFGFFKIDVQCECADMRRIAVHIYSLVALQGIFPSVVVDVIGIYLQEKCPQNKNKDERRVVTPSLSFIKRLIYTIKNNHY